MRSAATEALTWIRFWAANNFISPFGRTVRPFTVRPLYLPESGQTGANKVAWGGEVYAGSRMADSQRPYVRLQLSPGSFPKPLTPEEEEIYLARAAQGDLEARNILIERNLRLVAHIMNKS